MDKGDEVVQDQPRQNEGPKEELKNGLKLLADLSGISVKQPVDKFEVIAGVEMKNVYKVMNKSKVPIYTAKEESSFLAKLCCKNRLGFVIHIAGIDGQELITATKEFKWSAFFMCTLCQCSLHEMKVEAPVGSTCGYVDTKCSFLNKCNISFILKDSEKTPILKIKTNCFLCRGCPNIARIFKIYRINDNSIIGTLKKEWVVEKTPTMTDTFSITFPNDLDVCMKAVLLSSVFLLDFMFYEKRRRNK